MSRATALGDAIVADINVKDKFSLAFVAKRQYAPIVDKKELKNLIVTVLVPSYERSTQARLDNSDNINVSILVHKHIPHEENDKVDALTDFVEELADYFRDQNYGGAMWDETSMAVTHDIEDMVERQVFAASIHFVYRITWRKT